MKFEIKSRFSSAVLFTAELEAKYESEPASVQLGAAIKLANLARANLDGAYLARANLAGANLDGANLARANLDGANLDGANLVGANLDGANLDGANLVGANLARANLARANLDGALLLGKHPVIQLGPLGSRSAYLIAYLTDAGIKVKAGCFFGTLAEFEAAAANTHDDNEHGRDYVAAVAFIKAHFEIWK